MTTWEQKKEFVERVLKNGKLTSEDVDHIIKRVDACKHFCKEIQILATPEDEMIEKIKIVPIPYITAKRPMSSACFDHCLNCIHCNTQIIIEIFSLQKNIKTSFKYYGLLVVNPMVMKRIVLKNKYIFGKVLQSIFFMQNFTQPPNNDKKICELNDLFFRLFYASGPVQMQWIIDSEILIQHLPKNVGPASLCFMFKMIQYKKQNEIKIRNNHKESIYLFRKSYDHNKRKSLKQQIKSLKFTLDNADRHNIKCGNSKCIKSYVYNKYGNWFLENEDMWKDREIKNKWYLCSGCKVVKYCSRKCQKYAWNQENHKLRCDICSTADIMTIRI
eukprot:133512_1